MYYGIGFIHSDIYDMPTYLRKFYYRKLVDTKKKENEQIQKAQRSSKIPTNPRFKR